MSDTPEIMSAGFPGGRLRRWALRALLGAIVLLALGAAVGFAWVSWEDREAADLIPPGVSIEGIPVGSLTTTEAAALLRQEFAGLVASRTLSARCATCTYEIDVATLLSIDATRVVRDAHGLRATAEPLDRLRWQVLDETLDVDLPLRLQFDDTRLQAWIDGIASEIDTAAVDATRTADPLAGTFSVVPSREGRRLDTRRAFLMARETILAGEEGLDLPVETILPNSDGQELGLAIHVDLSERRLYLYDGADLVKAYGVAIGSPAHGTPRGEWTIIQKRYMPSWGNPGSAWAANMPDYIPPGPSNPLGTRALNLDAPGIRIHGTTQDWSIGHAASHGCMRMHRWDVEDLYDRVEVGVPVIITS